MRRLARSILILGFLFTGASGGCAGFTSEAQCHAFSDRMAEVQMMDLHPASQDAVYILRQHHENAWPKNLQRICLRKGELIGFRKDASGGITAIAGDQTIELQSEVVQISPPINRDKRPVFDYDWCRRETAGERAARIALGVAMFPLMLGAAGGGM